MPPPPTTTAAPASRWAAGRHALHVALRLAQLASASAVAFGVFVREAWRLRRDGRDGVLRAFGRAHVALCERLGATFIKVGQIASTSGDLLPPPLVEELARLRDQVPPFPFAQVHETIERSLGQPIEALFARFDEQPVAAASVAQVHEAVLRSNGERVAVKVRRPDILEKVRLDRAILLVAARAAERTVPSLRLVSLAEAVQTFCDAVEQQIHLRNEADNNFRFRANFAGDPDVRFPGLHPDACSDEVLTMEFVEGLREDELDAGRADLQRIVRSGMRCVCQMIFLHGFVHADLHPGNMRFDASGHITLFDLGLVGQLEDRERLTNARLLYAFATGDGATVAKLFFENAPHTATPDYSVYEREVSEYVERVRTRGLGNVELAVEIGRIFDILRRHRIQARSHMTMVNLALATAEGLGKRLAPELDLANEALPYLAEALGIPASAGPLRA
jgi:ubiquinone biosynthesis protein